MFCIKNEELCIQNEEFVFKMMNSAATCTPACAVSMHQFTTACGSTIQNMLAGDSRCKYTQTGTPTTADLHGHV